MLCAQDNSFQLITQLVEADFTCIDGFENEKVYLKKESIRVFDNGLFLNINQFMEIPISILHSDRKGCYLYLQEFFEGIYFCPGCNRPHAPPFCPIEK